MDNPPVNQEKIIGITKLSLCFKGFVVSLKLRKLNDFGDGYVLGFNNLFGSIGSELGIGSVINDKAEF